MYVNPKIIHVGQSKQDISMKKSDNRHTYKHQLNGRFFLICTIHEITSYFTLAKVKRGLYHMVLN